MLKQLTALSVFKNEVQLVVVLKSIVKLDDVWMPVDTFEDCSLAAGLFDQSLVDR